MNDINHEPLRTYDIHVKPELQELAIGVLLTNGLNSFEEIETQEGFVVLSDLDEPGTVKIGHKILVYTTIGGRHCTQNRWDGDGIRSF